MYQRVGRQVYVAKQKTLHPFRCCRCVSYTACVATNKRPAAHARPRATCLGVAAEQRVPEQVHQQAQATRRQLALLLTSPPTAASGNTNE